MNSLRFRDARVQTAIVLSIAATQCSPAPLNSASTQAVTRPEPKAPAVAVRTNDAVPAPRDETARQSPEVSEQQTQASATDPTREKALEIARGCITRKRRPDTSEHGSALVYEKATVTRPSELRARGEKGTSASRPDNFRVVWIPEAPPFDERVPNGIVLDVNLDTGACIFPKYIR